MGKLARDTVRYTQRDGNRILKFGITNDPERRELENHAAGVGGTLRREGPKVTRDSALGWERDRIEAYVRRNGHLPPGNKV